MEALGPEWEQLWRRCPEATPFQSAAWLIPWWKHLGQGELSVLTFRCEGRLSGLAPFCIQQGATSDQRRVVLLGTGMSDYLDMLVDPRHKQACLEATVKFLQEHQERWDQCDFQELRPGSNLLADAFGQHWDVQTERQSICPVLSFAAQADRFSQVIPASLHKKLQQYRRRSGRLSGARIEPATAENLPELLEALLGLHAARWNARGQPGVLAQEPVQQFLREAAGGLLQLGLLRLYGWRVESRLQAVLYGLTHAGRALFYLSGFAPELREFSPGTLLIGHSVERAFQERCREFDFLRGNEPYKYRWGAKDQWTFRRQFGPGWRPV